MIDRSAYRPSDSLDTVCAAFGAAAASVRLPVENTVPAGSAPEDVAGAAVAAGPELTMIPARVRRIDEALVQLGVDLRVPELARLDPGSATDSATAKTWTYMGMLVLRAGGSAATPEALGALFRTLGPSHAPSPFAAQIEYRSPHEQNPSVDVLTADGFALLPEGDLRVYLQNLAARTAMAELREGWRTAIRATEWATELCEAVEHELAQRRIGQATHDWLTATFGPVRLLLITALRSSRNRLTYLATLVLGLIMIREMLAGLRRRVPDGHYDLLANPMVLPPFFVPFLRDAKS